MTHDLKPEARQLAPIHLASQLLSRSLPFALLPPSPVPKRMPTCSPSPDYLIDRSTEVDEYAMWKVDPHLHMARVIIASMARGKLSAANSAQLSHQVASESHDVDSLTRRIDALGAKLK